MKIQEKTTNSGEILKKVENVLKSRKNPPILGSGVDFGIRRPKKGVGSSKLGFSGQKRGGTLPFLVKFRVFCVIPHKFGPKNGGLGEF